MILRVPKIYYVPWILPPYRGIAIPPFGIFIKNKFKGNEKILNHEMVHWKQYQTMGLFVFYLSYLYQKMTMGYDKMPMEMEARYEEDEYTKKHYSKVYHNKG